MALEGSIRDFGLSDILQLIHFQKKTGVLTVIGYSDKVRLMFHEGSVIGAESRKRLEENRMGKILIKKRLIKQEDLLRALKDQKTTGLMIGAMLLRNGQIGREELREVLQSQMNETVYQLFTWKEGSFEFRSEEVMIDQEMPITIDTQQILMESLRKVDEWSILEGRIAPDSVFKRTEKNDYAATPEEQEVLKHVDGENDVSIIIELSGLDDTQVSNAFASLLDHGVIASVEPSLVAAGDIALPVKTREMPVVKLILPAVIAFFFFLIAIWPAFLRGKETPWGPLALNRLRSVGHIEELRFMAEVYRYRNGAYPASLDQIGRSSDIWGSPYLYKVERDGVVVRSAGPDRKMGTEDDIY
jgi:hypothetical protein